MSFAQSLFFTRRQASADSHRQHPPRYDHAFPLAESYRALLPSLDKKGCLKTHNDHRHYHHGAQHSSSPPTKGQANDSSTASSWQPLATPRHTDDDNDNNNKTKRPQFPIILTLLISLVYHLNH